MQAHTAAVKKYMCGTCQKRFATRKAKKNHRKDAHPIVKATNAPERTHNASNTQKAPVGDGTQNAVLIQDLDLSTLVGYRTADLGSTMKIRPQSLPVLEVTHNIFSNELSAHKGITYTSLSILEEKKVLDELPQLCHPETRLRHEGYPLSAGTQPSDTTSKKNSVPDDFYHLPKSAPSNPKHKALVIDCEMGMTANGHDELIHLSIIDFFSGHVIADLLVKPSTPITDWRSHIHGINAARVEAAAEQGQALRGWNAARYALWTVADRDTIIIGQSVQNDLYMLRTSHSRIIDSAILTADAVLGKRAVKLKKRWPLPTLCQELLDIEIRQPSQPGGSETHDALEDALATRELVLACIRQPKKLEKWAARTRAEFYQPKSKKHLVSRAGRAGISLGSQQYQGSYGSGSEDEEVLRWEDVIDWETWPKSPPDSD